jgi:hypothetical protein
MNSKPIAIVGGVGSGKTVLLAVLTHKYATPKDGYSLEPRNKQAVDFVHKSWLLLNDGQWPPPNPPLQKNQSLDWDLHYPKGAKGGTAPLLTADIAGECWIEFITNNCNREQLDQHSEESLNKFISKFKNKTEVDLSEIHNLIKGSSCVLVLLNLADIINKQIDAEIEKWTPLAICHYLKAAKTQGSMAIVLTQTDKYNYCLNECDNDWNKVLEKYMPSLYAVIDRKNIKVIPVAAVAETRIDENGNVMPSANFHSTGTKELLDWVTYIFETKLNSYIWKKRLFTLLVLIGIAFILIAYAMIFVSRGIFVANIAGLIGMLLLVTLSCLIYKINFKQG